MVVDDGMILALATYDVVMVGIDHRRIGVRSHAEHTFEGSLTHKQLSRLCLQQGIIGLGILGNTHQCVATREVAHHNLMTVRKIGSLFLGKLLADK